MIQLELRRWQVELEEIYPRVRLSGGDDGAREHFEAELRAHPEDEAQIILAFSKIDMDVRDAIEERAAIRWAEGLPGDIESAVSCNITEQELGAEVFEKCT